MRNLLPKNLLNIVFFLLLSSYLFFIFVSTQSQAAGVPYVPARPGHQSVTVSATLGNYYLSVYGYIAPFASIVLYSDGVYLRATVADEKGYFLIPEILVKEGISNLCFDAIDFRRLGESYSCLKIAPVYGPTTIKDIFLPPTLGLARSEISAGSSTVAWGYSMPGAKVTLHFGNVIYTVTADSTGYYQVVLKDVKAGVYQLYSTAVLNDVPSIDQQKKVTLKALSWWEQFLQWLKELWNKIWTYLTSLSFGPLWLVIPILILIIILIFKLWPDKFTSLYNSRLFMFLPKALKREKPLHHKWFMGY